MQNLFLTKTQLTFSAHDINCCFNIVISLISQYKFSWGQHKYWYFDISKYGTPLKFGIRTWCPNSHNYDMSAVCGLRKNVLCDQHRKFHPDCVKKECQLKAHSHWAIAKATSQTIRVLLVSMQLFTSRYVKHHGKISNSLLQSRSVNEPVGGRWNLFFNGPIHHCLNT